MGAVSWIILLVTIVLLWSLAGIIFPFRPFKKRWVALASSLVCFGIIGVLASTKNDGEVRLPPENTSQQTQPNREELNWVTSDRLNRRTCASTNCGIVGQFFFRESIPIFERQGGWARVTETYDASCASGRSEYIDSGNSSCEPSNGITNGQFAEWVSIEFLSETHPADPAADARGVEELIAGSDDFTRYRTEFAEAAQSLIEQRRCSEQDFRETGGWVKSTNRRDEPIYFTYCGGATVSNRLYLNAETGEVFR